VLQLNITIAPNIAHLVNQALTYAAVRDSGKAGDNTVVCDQLNSLYREHPWLRTAVLVIQNPNCLDSCLVDSFHIGGQFGPEDRLHDIDIEGDKFTLGIHKV
jgi:hypothetical protein